MRINSIQSLNPKFGANVVRTPALEQAIEYMSMHRMRPRQKDYTEHHYLWHKIEYAMLNHPSQIDIFTNLKRNMGDFGYATSSVQTLAGDMNFRTMAAQGNVKPILNVWRDFLDPVNKERFNIIMGRKYSENYDSWWNTFIAPHWKNINKFFNE